LNVNLYFGFIFSSGVYTYIAQQDLDMTAHIPVTTNKAALVFVTIDTTGTAVMTKGAEVNISDLVLTDLPAIPTNTAFVCGAVRVYNGQTVFQEMHTNTDFIDLRFPTYAGDDAYSMAVWGSITGDIEDQTDLQSELAAIGNGASQFEIPGVLAVTTTAAAAWLITGDTTISAWYIFCKVTGSASDTIIDVNKNGTTIFTTQANRPTLAYNEANGWAISGTPDVTTFVAGDVITIDIDQIATGAADLSVVPDIAQTAAGLQVKDGSTTVNNVTELTGAGVAVVTTTGTGKATITVPSAAAPDYVKVSDVKAQNTAGGTFTSGAWQVRDINTEDSDTGNHCSIASNQITLATGTYECNILVPAFRCNGHQAKLIVAGGADILLGMSSLADSGADGSSNVSVITGKFVLASPTALEIVHRCTTTAATSGFGPAANFASEVYTVAHFWKIA